jgi:hypothetical protein
LISGTFFRQNRCYLEPGMGIPNCYTQAVRNTFDRHDSPRLIQRLHPSFE